MSAYNYGHPSRRLDRKPDSTEGVPPIYQLLSILIVVFLATRVWWILRKEKRN